MSQNTSEVLAKVNDTLSALQDAEKTCVGAIAIIDNVSQKATEARQVADNALSSIGAVKAIAEDAGVEAAGAKRAAESAQGTADTVKGVVDAAKANGQIGEMFYKGDADLDSIVEPGCYRILPTSGAAKNQPEKFTSIAGELVVNSQSGIVFQTLSFTNGIKWQRNRVSSGTWLAWYPVHGASTSITIYVSKTGSDTNTGLEADYPVATIGRAMQIARGLLQGPNPGCVLKLRLGEGNWGNVYFYSLPFMVEIYPYDGAAPAAWSAALPEFSLINVSMSRVSLAGVVAGNIQAARNGYIEIAAGYKKILR